jgi:hypothetical protein
MNGRELLNKIIKQKNCDGIKCEFCLLRPQNPHAGFCPLDNGGNNSNVLLEAKKKLANMEKPPITDTNYQPEPKQGGQVVYTELIKDVEARAEFGRDKYDQYLMTFDGRDTPVDAYQESLDVCFYIKKMLMERDLRCEWELTIDGYYKTTCEGSFVFNDCGPIENKYNFCPFCGKQIKSLPKMEDDGK